MFGTFGHGVLKPHGHLISVSPDGNTDDAWDTVNCCHCGLPMVIRPGSGKVRGFCGRCGGIFCGPHCEECVPVEQYLENIEQGRPLDYRPIRVAVPAAPPGRILLPSDLSQ